jgi:hypothetical protein
LIHYYTTKMELCLWIIIAGFCISVSLYVCIYNCTFVIQLYPFYYFSKPYMVRFRNIFFHLRLFQNKLVYYILYMLNHSVTHTHSVVDSSNNVVKKVSNRYIFFVWCFWKYYR